jgi:arginine/ornithine N-succinyltransferase beta subunit
VQCWTEYSFSNFLGEYIHLIFDNGTSLNCDLQNFGAIKGSNTVEVPYEKYPKYCELVSTSEPNNQSMVRVQNNVAANHKTLLHFWLFLGHFLFRSRIRRILIF